MKQPGDMSVSARAAAHRLGIHDEMMKILNKKRLYQRHTLESTIQFIKTKCKTRDDFFTSTIGSWYYRTGQNKNPKAKAAIEKALGSKPTAFELTSKRS